MKRMNLCLHNHLCTFDKILNFNELQFRPFFPCRYKKIHQQQHVLKKWVEKLISEGTIKQEWYEVSVEIDSMFNRMIIRLFRLKKLNTKRFLMMLLQIRKVLRMPRIKTGLIHHGKVSSPEKVLFHILKQAYLKKH